MLRSAVARLAAASRVAPRRVAAIHNLPAYTAPCRLRTFATAAPYAPHNANAPIASSSAAPSASGAAAVDEDEDDDYDDDDFNTDFRDKPLTEEEKNQEDWNAFRNAQMNLVCIGVVVFGVFLVRYWYKRERDHFLHHRHQQEPYSFFINRDDQVAAGFWPGRSCQFLEFNCFAATYDAAEKMLQEKQLGGKQEHADAHH